MMLKNLFVFGIQKFRSEIIWKCTSAHSNAQNYGNIHQTLFYYSKGDKPIWNQIIIPYDEEYIATYFRYKDKDGRRFKSEDLTVPSKTAKNDFEFLGKRPSAKRGWGYSIEEMERMLNEGRIFINHLEIGPFLISFIVIIVVLFCNSDQYVGSHFN